jgi:5-methylcytosine-specific restriction endonuclease McrA
MSEYRNAKRFSTPNPRFTKKPSAKQVRTVDYGSDWSVVSKTCLTLANYVCQDCGENRANRAHHIVPKSRGGSDKQINLKAVCETCHKKYHKHLK